MLNGTDYLMHNNVNSWHVPNVHFTYINLFNPHITLWGRFFLPFYKWEHWETEKIRNINKVTQLISSRVRIWIQAAWLPTQHFCCIALPRGKKLANSWRILAGDSTWTVYYKAVCVPGSPGPREQKERNLYVGEDAGGAKSSSKKYIWQ